MEWLPFENRSVGHRKRFNRLNIGLVRYSNACCISFSQNESNFVKMLNLIFFFSFHVVCVCILSSCNNVQSLAQNKTVKVNPFYFFILDFEVQRFWIPKIRIHLNTGYFSVRYFNSDLIILLEIAIKRPEIGVCFNAYLFIFGPNFEQCPKIWTIVSIESSIRILNNKFSFKYWKLKSRFLI